MDPAVSVVIPFYNEEGVLPRTLPAVHAYLSGRFGEDFELILVDDGSTDASPDIADSLHLPHTRVLRTPKNRGKGHAVRTGMLAATGGILLFTDCDLAYGCDVIGELYDFLTDDPGADMVVGSRAAHPDGYAGYSFFRRLFSRTYRALLRLFFALPVSDSQSGIKAFRRECAHAVFSLCRTDRYAFDFEVIMIGSRLGFSVREYPVRILHNEKGKIRFFRDSTRMLRDLFRIRRYVRTLPKTARHP